MAIKCIIDKKEKKFEIRDTVIMDIVSFSGVHFHHYGESFKAGSDFPIKLDALKESKDIFYYEYKLISRNKEVEKAVMDDSRLLINLLNSLKTIKENLDKIRKSPSTFTPREYAPTEIHSVKTIDRYFIKVQSFLPTFTFNIKFDALKTRPMGFVLFDNLDENDLNHLLDSLKSFLGYMIYRYNEKCLLKKRITNNTLKVSSDESLIFQDIKYKSLTKDEKSYFRNCKTFFFVRKNDIVNIRFFQKETKMYFESLSVDSISLKGITCVNPLTGDSFDIPFENIVEIIPTLKGYAKYENIDGIINAFKKNFKVSKYLVSDFQKKSNEELFKKYGYALYFEYHLALSLIAKKGGVDYDDSTHFAVKTIRNEIIPNLKNSCKYL